MKYMLLVYLAEDALSASEREHCYVESAQLARDLPFVLRVFVVKNTFPTPNARPRSKTKGPAR